MTPATLMNDSYFKISQSRLKKYDYLEPKLEIFSVILLKRVCSYIVTVKFSIIALKSWKISMSLNLDIDLNSTLNFFKICLKLKLFSNNFLPFLLEIIFLLFYSSWLSYWAKKKKPIIDFYRKEVRLISRE
jgi:hypothetical protein